MRMGEIATRALKFPGIKAIGALAAGLLFSWAAPAQAAVTINYAPPPIPSNNVMFTVVNESSGTNTPPLYGPPDNPAPNDTLHFSNMSGFTATSSDGNPGIDFVDGLLNATVQAKRGSFITGFDLSEFGDWSLGRLLNATGSASAYPTSPGIFVTITGINGSPVSGSPTLVPITYTPTPPYTFAGTELVRTGSWSGTSSFAITTPNVTEIQINLNNQLYAASEAGTSASISKKGLGLHIDSVQVPEPASLAIFGLVGLLSTCRRRRSA